MVDGCLAGVVVYSTVARCNRARLQTPLPFPFPLPHTRPSPHPLPARAPAQVNATGVMPVIFASSLLALPSALARYASLPVLEAAAVELSPGGRLYLPVSGWACHTVSAGQLRVNVRFGFMLPNRRCLNGGEGEGGEGKCSLAQQPMCVYGL